MKSIRILIVITSLVGVTLLLHAQNGQEKVSLEQFHSLHKKGLDLFQRVETPTSLSPRKSLSLEEEMLATTKLLEHLDIDSQRLNLDGFKNGKEASRTLLLIANGAQTDELMLAFLDSYLTTKNSEFLVLAKSARVLSEKIDGLL